MKRLLLVDFENVHKVNLGPLDESFRAVIFVGAKQNPPKGLRHAAAAQRFQRVDFLKISGEGKNALDFHIAFHLGRTFETAPETECFVLSRDKGFDPLLRHLNEQGLKCQRIHSMDELLASQVVNSPESPGVACRHCGAFSSLEHYGGIWCSNCGRFASKPDDALLPSNQQHFRERHAHDNEPYRPIMSTCGWCDRHDDMTGGIYDDGEWMCGACIAHYARSC
jgi:hypothetical protein